MSDKPNTETENQPKPTGDGIANPAPLGLMGFGMTTVLLNLHNADLIAMGSVIAAMGIFYGGMAQLIAGWWEMKKNNTFGATAFSSYGLFWMTLVAIWMIPALFSEGDSPHILGNDLGALGAYLFMWGLFTGCMAVALFYGKANWALKFVFISLTILFWLLAAGHAGSTTNSTIIKVAGYEGIICGLSAIYLAMAEVINENAGKEIVPIFEVK